LFGCTLAATNIICKRREAPVLASRRSRSGSLVDATSAPGSCNLEHKVGEIFSIEERELTNCTQ